MNVDALYTQNEYSSFRVQRFGYVLPVLIRINLNECVSE